LNDPWVFNISINRLPTFVNQELVESLNFVSELRVDGNSWNENLLLECFLVFLVYNRIIHGPIAHPSMGDHLVWTLLVVYLPKPAYEVASEGMGGYYNEEEGTQRNIRRLPTYPNLPI